MQPKYMRNWPSLPGKLLLGNTIENEIHSMSVRHIKILQTFLGLPTCLT